MKKTAIAIAALCAFSLPAAADAIEGNWKRPTGVIVKFAACGGAFCATALTGPNAGKSVGKLTASGSGTYKGSLSDPSAGKTYTGKAAVTGGTLKVSGCIMGGLLCKSESWAKQ